ncbi:MAG: hypothetical protein IJW98_01860 [Clostridia bacterium]|nr:hypothetical protein [Clostridia bacterium]
MKGWKLWKEVIKYHWCDVLFDRFYSREYSTLPVNDIWQDIAKRWTFEWGLSVGGLPALIVFLGSMYFFIDWRLIFSGLLAVCVAFFVSSISSCIYLYIRMRMYYRPIEEAEKKAREEQEGQNQN